MKWGRCENPEKQERGLRVGFQSDERSKVGAGEESIRKAVLRRGAGRERIPGSGEQDLRGGSSLRVWGYLKERIRAGARTLKESRVWGRNPDREEGCENWKQSRGEEWRS